METPEMVMKQVEEFGFSDNPVFDKLLSKLAYLAGKWRTTKEDAVAEQYQTVLRTLILIGYDRELAVDMELPDEFLPSEYLDLFDTE